MKKTSHSDIEKEIVHRSKFRDLYERPGSLLPHLIDHLDRIDSKVGALLSFNGILAAVLTLVITNLKAISDNSILGFVFLVFSTVFAAASLWICLKLIYLYGYHSSEGISAEEYQMKILEGVARRTREYNLALVFLKGSVILLFLYLGLVLATRGPELITN